MLNNKKFIEICEYGVKYTRSLKLDVEVHEICDILIKSLKIEMIDEYTFSDIEDIIEEYFEDILDNMEDTYETDFYEEELEEEIDTWVEHEEEYEYEYEYEYEII